MIVIAGGGPAGCVAAKEVAISGAKVTVFEEHRKLGEPVQCSGLVSKKGLERIGVDYSGSVRNEIRGAEIFAPGARLRVVSKDAKALVISRGEYDSACASEAESEGARIILGKRAPGPNAGAYIGADGVFSRTAKLAGFPEHEHLVSCYQTEFSGAKIQDKGLVSVYITRFAPGFFAWAIPVNEERARIGLGVSVGKNPKKHFDLFAKSLSTGILEGARMESSLAGFIPLSPRRETVRGNVMLVGDAAGQVKALSGGGVYFGCSCAKIAGRIAGSDMGAVGGCGGYEKEWRKEFGTDLLVHHYLRKALDVLPPEGAGFLMLASKLLFSERLLVRYGDMDRPTEMARAFHEDSAGRVGKRFNNITSTIIRAIGSFGSGADATVAHRDNP